MRSAQNIVLNSNFQHLTTFFQNGQRIEKVTAFLTSVRRTEAEWRTLIEPGPDRGRAWGKLARLLRLGRPCLSSRASGWPHIQFLFQQCPCHDT